MNSGCSCIQAQTGALLDGARNEASIEESEIVELAKSYGDVCNADRLAIDLEDGSLATDTRLNCQRKEDDGAISWEYAIQPYYGSERAKQLNQSIRYPSRGSLKELQG